MRINGIGSRQYSTTYQQGLSHFERRRIKSESGYLRTGISQEKSLILDASSSEMAETLIKLLIRYFVPNVGVECTASINDTS